MTSKLKQRHVSTFENKKSNAANWMKYSVKDSLNTLLFFQDSIGLLVNQMKCERGCTLGKPQAKALAQDQNSDLTESYFYVFDRISASAGSSKTK